MKPVFFYHNEDYRVLNSIQSMDKDVYLTIAKPSEGIFRDRGSKFMAFAFPVEDEAGIKKRLDETRKKYHDARHHCFAWKLGPSTLQYRVNDDGEPHNSAGKPILGQIHSFNLFYVLVIVVRYFGGTLLGISGLVNAYKTAAYLALSNAAIVEKHICHILKIKFRYDHMNHLMKVIKDMDLEHYDQIFEQTCELKVKVPESKVSLFESSFKLHPDIESELIEVK